MIRSLLITLLLGLVLAPVADARVSYAELVRQNRVLRAQVDTQANTIVFLRGRVTYYAAARNTALQERNAALSGLPAAISAVPGDQFRTLVLDPARAEWLCDDYYTSDGYWSISFYNAC